MSIESMKEAWDSMPEGHLSALRGLKSKVMDIAAKVNEEVIAILRVRQHVAGDFALIATMTKLILINSGGSSTQVLRYSQLRGINFTRAKKKRFGLDKEAYLLIDDGSDSDYTFVIYRDAEWVNETAARIESAFESAQLQL